MHFFYFQKKKRDPIVFGDFQESDLEFPEKRKKFLKIANQTVCKYKKMNKYYTKIDLFWTIF